MNVAAPEEKKSRAVRVMTRSQLSATAMQEENTKRLPECEIDLSPEAIREVQRGEVCLRTILDLLDAGSEKPPWSTVEGADLEVQQRHAQWKTLQLGDGILYRNFLGTDGHVDLTGPHVRSNNGSVYLLTSVDYFTKYLTCVPIRDKTALSVAKALVKHVYLLFGYPILQISDMSGEFQNDVMRR